MSNTRLPTDNIDPLIPLSDGHWVNERVANLVDAIREYHPQLDVMWNPNPPPNEPEFKIIETTPTGRFVVMTISDQEHFDGDVLTRIILGDTSRHDVLDEIDARQKAAMLLAGKEVQERQEYIKDVTKHVLKSPLNKYVVDKNTVIRDHGNRTR